MRHVLFVSGSRADYGPARRLLMEIDNDNELELSILVTGMHLDPVHGETWREIEADGLRIAERIHGRVVGDSLEAMVASVGLYLYGMSRAIARIRPDILLVLGDRGEQLAGAMAGAFQNIVVAHLCGGAISGSIDDSIRHAITKFSHYHLPGFDEHARRIIQMGESPDRVHVVGLPGGDIRRDVVLTREKICAEYGLPIDRPYLLVVQHSVSHQKDCAGTQMIETLEALITLECPILLANPNDDAGGREILRIMTDYARQHSQVHLLPPTRSRERFASIMAGAGVLVGNSSSALVEAMSVGVAVVNIGDRQRGREHLACWLNVPHAREEIHQAVETALHDEDHRQQLALHCAHLALLDTEDATIDLLRSMDLSVASRPKEFLDFLDIDAPRKN